MVPKLGGRVGSPFCGVADPPQANVDPPDQMNSIYEAD